MTIPLYLTSPLVSPPPLSLMLQPHCSPRCSWDTPSTLPSWHLYTCTWKGYPKIATIPTLTSSSSCSHGPVWGLFLTTLLHKASASQTPACGPPYVAIEFNSTYHLLTYYIHICLLSASLQKNICTKQAETWSAVHCYSLSLTWCGYLVSHCLVDGCMDRYMDACMHGWMDEWTNNWMNKWMNEWMNEYLWRLHRLLGPAQGR